jgi:hypothetical protein
LPEDSLGLRHASSPQQPARELPSARQINTNLAGSRIASLRPCEPLSTR